MDILARADYYEGFYEVELEKINMTDTTSALMKASGQLAADDEDTFKEIVTALIDDWKLSKPKDVMMVNRMVSVWMKMRRVEKMLTEVDLYFEHRNKHGEINNVTINSLANYLNSLDSQFRSYYKTLEMARGGQESEGPKDFYDYINEIKDAKTGSKKNKE